MKENIKIVINKRQYIGPLKMFSIMFTILLSIFIICSFDSDAAVKEKKDKKEKIQRTATGNFDQQTNTVSNFKFPVTNYGILFLDVAQNRGGGFWPRGSLNQYVFGGGIWFAAQKWLPADSIAKDEQGNVIKDYLGINDSIVRFLSPNKLCELTYNPNSGASWMVPGRIEDGDEVITTDDKLYRSYFSTDFRTSDGIPVNSSDGPNWPVWDASTNDNDSIKSNRYFGYFIADPEERNIAKHKKGPAFISGEDIFVTYKDTDLNSYERGVSTNSELGYPLRLQFEQYIYSWGFGDYKDFIFIRYEIINKSSDVFTNCWVAPVMDVDIALSPNTQAGADNDYARYYDEDESLNLAVQWTRENRGEKGKGFGYLGFDFLESPAVHRCERRVLDSIVTPDTVIYVNNCEMCVEKDTVDGELVCVEWISFPDSLINVPRKDRRWYTNDYQLGLKTFRRWPIDQDIPDDANRYDYLAIGEKEPGVGEPADYRFLMSTGPFNFQPHDTVRIVVGMILANAIKDDADGSTADLVELIRKDKFAQQVYDNNFQAPIPPDKSIIYRWDPLNHGIVIQWDSTAEITNDIYERGLDFMGLRLYRARRTDLDTFDVDEVSPSIKYASGKGPMGWKQLAHWVLPTPFRKSYNRAGTNNDDAFMPFIDSLEIVGPSYVRNEAGQLVFDPFGIKVMRIAKGLVPFGPQTFVKNYMGAITRDIYPQRSWTKANTLNVFIHSIDTSESNEPWAKYYLSQTKPSDFPLWYDPYFPDDQKNRNFLLDSVLIGTVKLNNALLDFNPLYWERVTINVNPGDTASFPNGMDTTTKLKYLKDTYRSIIIDGVPSLVVDQLRPVDMNVAMTDTALVQKALDSIYSFIQRGLVKEVTFPDFEAREDVREGIIAPFMKKLTGGNRFVDIGDDNRSGDIGFNVNPTKTEKLINNVPYHYKLLAYDEGDYNQPTPAKLNAIFEGVKTYPRAASVMEPPEFKVLSIDTTRIGGLYNFKFFGIDNDRIRQLLSGHTLEMEFNPFWMYSNFAVNKENSTTPVIVPYGLYSSMITIKDLTDNNKVLFQGTTYLEQTSGRVPLFFGPRGAFTENSQSWVVDYENIEDPIKKIIIDLPSVTSDTVLTRTSTITTGDFKQPGYYYTSGFNSPAYGTMGFSFNYTAQQWGGVYRPDSSSLYPPMDGRPSPIVSGDMKVPINFLTDLPGTLSSTYDSSIVYRSQINGVIADNMKLYTIGQGQQYNFFLGFESGRYSYGSFNNGPAEYLVEFKAGGKETLSLKSEKLGSTKDFVCDYLLMDVKNVISYKRPSLNGDSVLVTYPLAIEHMEIDTGFGNKFPHLGMLGRNSNDFIGRYNLSAYGWINGYNIKSTFSFNQMYAVPSTLNSNHYKTSDKISIGKQGRFYLNGRSTDGVDSVYFVNAFLASGVTFVFDLAKNERTNGTTKQWKLENEAFAMNNVLPKPGDKVLLKTQGGALGFPMPGAKVLLYIDSNYVSEGQYTDDLLDQVGVVPNPYYITHEGQASPYDAKIYFTRLPKRATINIYTISGDLVHTMEHNEFTSTEKDKVGAEVWDLLTKNRQRVQSQTFVAVIKTPDGAQTVKKFSVVVGGFRLVPEDE